MAKSTRNPLDRRRFLKGAAVSAAAGAAALVTPASSAAQVASAPPPRGNAPSPSAAALSAETEPLAADTPADLTVENAGSDFMVDVIKSLGFEYIAANPGSSFRGLHESFINYGGNKNPELLTCCHEESSVALADGYFRVEGRPMLVWPTARSGCSTRR